MQPSPENELIFREVAHEKHGNDAAGEAFFHHSEARRGAGAVCAEARSGFYPKTDADARRADPSHSRHGRKEHLEGAAWAFPQAN